MVAVLLLLLAAGTPGSINDFPNRILSLEQRTGSRIGVAALDTRSGKRLDYRSEERFPMCSTFKFLAAAAVLKRVDEKQEQLDRFIRYEAKDILEYAPVTKAHLNDGGMALGALCAAAIEQSDNTAGNLLLDTIGGPVGLTNFMRSAYSISVSTPCSSAVKFPRVFSSSIERRSMISLACGKFTGPGCCCGLNCSPINISADVLIEMTNEEKFAGKWASCEASEKCSSAIEGVGEEGDAGAALAGREGSPRPRRSRMTKPCSSSLLMSPLRHRSRSERYPTIGLLTPQPARTR